MPLVKVWNKNVHPLQERFRDQDILIPPGGFILMDEEEAHIYKGQYKPIIRTADGGHDPRGFKMLDIQPHVEGAHVATKVEKHLCQACGFEGTSKSALDEHIDEKHLDQLQDKEFAEKRRKAKKKTD